MPIGTPTKGNANTLKLALAKLAQSGNYIGKYEMGVL